MNEKLREIWIILSGCHVTKRQYLQYGIVGLTNDKYNVNIEIKPVKMGISLSYNPNFMLIIIIGTFHILLIIPFASL